MRHRSALRRAIGCFVVLLLGAAPVEPAYAQQSEPFRVEVGGRIDKQVFLLVGPDGRLAAGRDDLATWGLLEGLGPLARLEGIPETVELYWLDELADIAVEVDPETRIVRLTPTPESLTSEVQAGQRADLTYDLRRAWGADLTYRASALTRPEANPLLDVRGGLGFSLGSIGRLLTTLDAGRRTFASSTLDENGPSASRSVIRDTRFRRDFGDGYVFHAGQITANPGGLGSGLRILGGSVGTNLLGRRRTTLSSQYTGFEDLVILAEPATVQVRVNGRLIADRAVGVGRLSISDIPVDAGDNDVQILVRHADGRLEIFEHSIVGGVDLIGSGESEIGAAAGMLGLEDIETDRYRNVLGSLFFARGLSEDHTLRVSSEGRTGSSRHVATRLQWSSRLPGGILAEAGASLSASRTPEGAVRRFRVGPTLAEPRPVFPDAVRGWESDFRLMREFGAVRLAVGGSGASERYLTMRQEGFAQSPRWRGRVDWLFRSKWLGTLGLRYRYQEEWGTTPGGHSSFATLQRRVGSGNLRLQGGYDGRPGTGGIVGSVGLTLALGNGGARANMTVRSGSSGTRSSSGISRSLSSNARGLAWSAQANHFASGSGASSLGGNASARYRGSAFEARGSARVADGTWSGNAEIAGSLVLISSRLFASSPVGPSYVLIDTGEAPGISVLRDRRSVGTTGRRGALFMPFVPSLSTSQIELDPRSLEVGMIGEQLRQQVTFAPGASTISFAVRRSLQAIMTLLDDAGDAWPSGTEIWSEGDRILGYVGKNGLAHVSDLIIGEDLQVVAGDRRCRLRLDLAGFVPGVVRLGDVRCSG